MTLVSAFVAWIVLVSPASADPIWKFNWTTDNGVLPTQTGGVALATTPAGQFDGPTATLQVANLTLFGSLAASVPESLTSGNYAFDVELEDVSSGAKGELTFTGQLSGTFSATTMGLTNTFLEGAKTLTLGANDYTVQLSDYLPPGSLSQGTNGWFLATVQVAPHVVDPPVVAAPEPGALTLLGLGLSTLALSRRRRVRPT